MAASLKDKRMPITTPPYQVPSIDVTPDPPIFSLVTTFKNNLFGLKIHNFFDADPYPGSRIFLTLDPGSGIRNGKNSDPGSVLLSNRKNFFDAVPSLFICVF